MKATDMTETELEIMEALWAKGEPLFLGELLEYFNFRTGKDWKKQTMNTCLFRMQQKSLVEAVGGGRYKRYVPLITREKYTADASRAFLDRNYGGSFARMFAALSGGEQIDKEEIRELRRKLEEWEKQ